jgi:hypothetical protein
MGLWKTKMQRRFAENIGNIGKELCKAANGEEVSVPLAVAGSFPLCKGRRGEEVSLCFLCNICGASMEVSRLHSSHMPALDAPSLTVGFPLFYLPLPQAVLTSLHPFTLSPLHLFIPLQVVPNLTLLNNCNLKQFRFQCISG